MNSEKLQAAYRAATIDCPLDGDGCPTAGELSATARGELDAAQRERMLAIIANCARCAAVVQMAGDLDEPRADPPPLRAPARRTLRWIGAALAASLAVVAVWVLRPPLPPVTRGNGDEVNPAPNAVLREAPTEFVWHAPEGAACHVTVRSDTAEVVLRGASSLGGRLELGAAERARLARGEFLWTADCGATRFGPYAFSVTP